MNDFQKHALSAYKSNLAGLPSFCRLVMYEVFEYIDLQSGTISINSLEKLAIDDFKVDPLRGRQKENINGDTIRNAFRTIKKAKPDHFKFTTVNQQIVIEMPFLRELHQSIYNKKSEVAAVLAVNVAAATTFTQSGESADLESYSTGDVAGELAAASLNDTINVPAYSRAKIKPNLQPNNNEKQFVSELAGNVKKTIPDDFQPSQSMIDHALRLGLHKVSDLSELSKFIIFNKACGSRWANWDYVYLNWLMRDAEREQEKAAVESQQPKQNPVSSRRDFNERNRHAIKPTKPTVEDAMRANSDAIAPWECIQYEPIGNVITSDDFLVLG